MQPIISIKDVSKTYKSGVQALQPVSLDIMKGEIFALLGPNGAGKTTLINMTCGIVNLSGGTVVAEEVHDAPAAGPGALAFPYTLRAGQSVEDAFHVAGVDLPAQLRRYGLEGLDPRVEVFVRVVVDVQGSPFDPEFELPVAVR